MCEGERGGDGVGMWEGGGCQKKCIVCKEWSVCEGECMLLVHVMQETRWLEDV